MYHPSTFTRQPISTRLSLPTRPSFDYIDILDIYLILLFLSTFKRDITTLDTTKQQLLLPTINHSFTPHHWPTLPFLMFAAHASHIQPTTPMQFPVPVYGHPAPMVMDDYHYDNSYTIPSPEYRTYQPKPYYTPTSPDDVPKMPSISVPPTVNLNLLTPPPTHIASIATTPHTFASIPNTISTQSVKKEMHMAIAGTDSAQAGIDTPIARHVGMSSSLPFASRFG